MIKKIRIAGIVLLFIVYFIMAARPIPRETILASEWISSLQSESTESTFLHLQGQLIPFTLGNNFGYVNTSGQFAFNKEKTGNIYLGKNLWTEYDLEPSSIGIKNISEETVINIENPGGYPLLLDNRIFILGSEQNALSEISAGGDVLWTYEFGAPLTCMDAAADMILTGSIDGHIDILDSYGKRIFNFEPGGSRYAVILGCALSNDGSHLGIISGIDQQRFLLLERFGNSGEYKVVYHEFLGDGFRRPVHISFIDNDQRLVFESSQGIGCYNVKSRYGIQIPLNGEIITIDNSGDQGFFFLITSHSMGRKEFVGIKFPEDSWLPLSMFRQNVHSAVFLKAPFKSDNAFLGRTGSKIIAGGGTALISFNLEEK
ncbi:MAG: WD40 repeat domain-containing protein [Treponema sp.]|nr:WD40 repeat domain-containing protein [Treponema sp.]